MKATEVKSGTILAKAIGINIIILVIVLFGRYNDIIPIIGGSILLLFLTVGSLLSPKNTFFLLFGIKFTYDLLWPFKFSGLGDLGFLELFLIPVGILNCLGLYSKRIETQWLIWYSMIFVLWLSLIPLFNGTLQPIEIIIRESGILLGAIMGSRYIETKNDFNILFYCLLISTIIPVLTPVAQLIAHLMGSEILCYKLDLMRGYRYSGLCYDSGTLGMTSLVSTACSTILLNRGMVGATRKTFLLTLLVVNLLVAIVGGTRSIIALSLACLVISVATNPKRLPIVITMVLIAISLAKPQFDAVFEKTKSDSFRDFDAETLLEKDEYRTMLTGRVSLWQTVWTDFKKGSLLQKLFGSGKYTNAHSSYFALLLQMGVLGLLYYLWIHFYILWRSFTRLKSVELKSLTTIVVLLILGVGISLNVISYTSFQWCLYMLIAGAFKCNQEASDTNVVDYEHTFISNTSINHSSLNT